MQTKRTYRIEFTVSKAEMEKWEIPKIAGRFTPSEFTQDGSPFTIAFGTFDLTGVEVRELIELLNFITETKTISFSMVS